MVAKRGPKRPGPRIVTKRRQQCAERLGQIHLDFGFATIQCSGDPGDVEAMAAISRKRRAVRFVQRLGCRHDPVVDHLRLGVPWRVHSPVKENDPAIIALGKPGVGALEASRLGDGEDGKLDDDRPAQF
jgi:hypothetical protein